MNFRTATLGEFAMVGIFVVLLLGLIHFWS
jgi:hypothetical protein